MALAWSKDSRTIYGLTPANPRSKLLAVDVRTNVVRKVAEYDPEQLYPASAIGGGLRLTFSADCESLTVGTIRRQTDLWILEGFPTIRERFAHGHARTRFPLDGPDLLTVFLHNLYVLTAQSFLRLRDVQQRAQSQRDSQRYRALLSWRSKAMRLQITWSTDRDRRLAAKWCEGVKRRLEEDRGASGRQGLVAGSIRTSQPFTSEDR
jgi:hypothetical protein